MKIGVFDSGVGGLTVLKALKAQLPGAQFFYLGDMARLPYGTKSSEAVIAYTLKATHQLLKQGIDGLVVACSTASSCAIGPLRAAFPHLPIIDVISPTVASVSKTGAHSVLVLATQGTVSSHMYQSLFAVSAPHIQVHERATPLLVGLAEEGWSDASIIKTCLDRYLNDFDHLKQVDTVILGCTHFPMHGAAIQHYFGSGVDIVDTALPAAQEAFRIWAGARESHTKSPDYYYVTDSPDRFRSIASYFLGHAISPDEIELINL